MSDNANSPRERRDDPSREAIRQEGELLQSVLDRLGIREWDLLIVGDGSGSNWERSCGWAAVLVDRNNVVGRNMSGRRFFYGALNQGSVNLAESMPYLHTLAWYDAVYGRQALKDRGLLHVHILTDSQTIAQWGTRAMDPTATPPRKGLIVWSAMRELRRVGYHCTMHWAPRMTTDMNWAADLIAGLSRRQMEAALDVNIHADVAHRAALALDRVQFQDPGTGAAGNPYQLNPDGVPT